MLAIAPPASSGVPGWAALAILAMFVAGGGVAAWLATEVSPDMWTLLAGAPTAEHAVAVGIVLVGVGIVPAMALVALARHARRGQREEGGAAREGLLRSLLWILAVLVVQQVFLLILAFVLS